MNWLIYFELMFKNFDYLFKFKLILLKKRFICFRLWEFPSKKYIPYLLLNSGSCRLEALDYVFVNYPTWWIFVLLIYYISRFQVDECLICDIFQFNSLFNWLWKHLICLDGMGRRILLISHLDSIFFSLREKETAIVHLHFSLSHAIGPFRVTRLNFEFISVILLIIYYHIFINKASFLYQKII